MSWFLLPTELKSVHWATVWESSKCVAKKPHNKTDKKTGETYRCSSLESLTLLLTAMAFKWVLKESTPNVPYLTVMEKYVVATYAMLLVQGLAFWMLADAYNFEGCGEYDYSRIDWVLGSKKNSSTALSEVQMLNHDQTCEQIHFADRCVLLLELLCFITKNIWFLYRLLLNRKSELVKEKNFTDLSYLKEYMGKHMKFVGEEEQIKEGNEGA